MRSNKEIAEEAHRRAAATRKRLKRRRERLKIGVLITGCVMLAVGLAALTGLNSGAEPAVQAAVTILDGEAAGGYVLVGVLGFALGGFVMFICLQRVKKADKNGGDSNEKKDISKDRRGSARVRAASIHDGHDAGGRCNTGVRGRCNTGIGGRCNAGTGGRCNTGTRGHINRDGRAAR